ncbi:hypothetical protein [Sphingomonas mucosissima]|uniref:Uncharacterized protein n=1 Tax=Sphingomonas mucosissima TaxID=370959 RepID=A0A245ZR92_9SPHN|nr:hypothetical protein [Sphingomonas mucosissima]OWK32262.1 hypothetical protein SPMU_05840 [Sphingomonas mucosissima]
MTQFANIGRSLTAIAFAIVFSTTMVIGAVGPAGGAAPLVHAVA